MTLILEIVAALLIVQMLPAIIMIVGCILGWIFIGFMNVVNWVLYLPYAGRQNYKRGIK